MADAPPSLRARMGALRTLPPFLAMVWRTSPGLTAGLLALRLVRALLPVATLFVGKLIIDATSKLPEELGSGVGSRQGQNDGQGGGEVAFVPHASTDLPTFEGVLGQRQTKDGYWYVALDKTRAGQAQELARQFAVHPAAAGVRHLLICDESTDVHNEQDVWWTILNNIDPERDVHVLGHLLAWDGARKLPEEGFVRPWPPKINMDKSVMDKVDARWHLYGLSEQWR